ncbi:MAG: flagellar basal body rod protein FlgC [Phycisphaeraceae bacterium]|nr:MAG: flagellar basal body rod protein FlgC [Phycisphaeraceae bacterium]
MYGSLDISVSGMIAQRTRLEVIQSNIANMHVLEDAEGNFAPYLRRAAMFAPGDPAARTDAGRRLGVHVAEIQADERALVRRHDPSNPHADRDGYVMVPDINPVVENINAMEAARAYEANVAAAETTKAMMAQALRLLA